VGRGKTDKLAGMTVAGEVLTGAAALDLDKAVAADAGNRESLRELPVPCSEVLTG
jgi:hypothetical protein